MGSLLDRTKHPDVTCRTFSVADRYEWIRGHRGDPVIESALCNSNFDGDFDRRIDAAIENSRRGLRQPLGVDGDEFYNKRAGRRGAAPVKALHHHRRRDDVPVDRVVAGR